MMGAKHFAVELSFFLRFRTRGRQRSARRLFGCALGVGLKPQRSMGRSPSAQEDAGIGPSPH
jgi:hypothetical protein